MFVIMACIFAANIVVNIIIFFWHHQLTRPLLVDTAAAGTRPSSRHRWDLLAHGEDTHRLWRVQAPQNVARSASPLCDAVIQGQGVAIKHHSFHAAPLLRLNAHILLLLITIEA